ncbi:MULTISPECIES: TraR/DksA family transcriptional regulator [Ramlibacter]|jgi:DnaK suppressor protein|nr:MULTISPECIES: TraR/DksA family transcriptional regulator [Ramlibacter]MBA2962248.1 TraR/DksA family transcriptional regulator [Ramlibacter sp. CGMCC 1.13660]
MATVQTPSITDAQRGELRQLLDRREADLRAGIRLLREALAAPAGVAEVRDSVEDGDARAASSTELTQLRRLEDELHAVLHARDRMRSGDYGRCEECDEPIPLGRLQARPEARLCLQHEEAWEKAHPQGAPVQAT